MRHGVLLPLIFQLIKCPWAPCIGSSLPTGLHCAHAPACHAPAGGFSKFKRQLAVLDVVLIAQLPGSSKLAPLLCCALKCDICQPFLRPANFEAAAKLAPSFPAQRVHAPCLPKHACQRGWEGVCGCRLVPGRRADISSWMPEGRTQAVQPVLMEMLIWVGMTGRAGCPAPPVIRESLRAPCGSE